MLIVLMVALLVLVGGYYAYHKMTKSFMMPTEQTTQNTIQSDSGLMSASSDLDNTNIDSMDTELNQNTQDTSSF